MNVCKCMNMHIEDSSGDKKYFTIIPNYILNHSTLWDREVYVQMKRITGENGTCWTSQQTLAKQCGMSVNRLKKSLKYLIEHRWIKNVGIKKIKTTGGIQSVNVYRVADLWKMNSEYYQSKGVSRYDRPNAKGVSREGSKGYHQKATKKNLEEERSLNRIVEENTSEKNIKEILEKNRPEFLKRKK